MPFPAIKLGYLAIRQVSKPLANYMKQRAKTHPFFREKILIKSGQIYHRLDILLRMRILGFKTQSVEPLSDEKAMELAADMFGEFIIYAMAALTVYLEYTRQSWDKVKHEASQERRLADIRKNLTELNLQLDEQQAELRAITRQVHATQELLEKTLAKKKGWF